MENHPLRMIGIMVVIAAHALSAQSLPPRAAITPANAASLKLRVLARIRGNAYDITSTADSRAVAVHGVGIDGGEILFDLETGREVARCDRGGGTYALAATGWTVVIGRGSDIRVDDIRLCYPQGGPNLLTTPAQIQSLRFARDGNCLLASGHADGTVRLWDVCKGETLWTSPPTSSPVLQLAVAPDGKSIAAAHKDSTLRLWPVGGNRARLAPLANVKSDMRFRALTFIANGHKIVVALGNETAVWDISTNDLKKIAKGADAVSPDGQMGVTLAEDRIMLWNLGTGADIAVAKAPEILTSTAFTPDGTALLAGTIDGQVLVWHPEEEK